MSKRRFKAWDNDETYQFQSGNDEPLYPFAVDDETVESIDADEPTEMLEEAHQAISKLFNKTNKRATQMRGVRRKDAWQ